MRGLRKLSDYDSASSEAEEVKQTIAFFQQEASSLLEKMKTPAGPTRTTNREQSVTSATTQSATTQSESSIVLSDEEEDDDDVDVLTAPSKSAAWLSKFADVDKEEEADNFPTASGLSKPAADDNSVGSEIYGS